MCYEKPELEIIELIRESIVVTSLDPDGSEIEDSGQFGQL